MNQELNTETLNELKKKIVNMLEKISDETLLNRVYRFVKYIYIYKS